ncbi:GDSL-like protein [Neisseria lactamica ATCC 23970]|uniref:GDSL-like protein n=2 Tax=Neisseria TaxID=482 RepID=D0W691_NEILA|nr:MULTISPECIES: arylesterase [Neisseria]EEZ76837.1 GDSL-like protein [Neisseria lactamica ATCC 23970]KFJ35960.1 GDSL-like Lipase/Acylhydrolase family protein [Neisseria lactamica ATCC 23970]MBW4011190.1 arylesterase [Neisseria meningitidis]VTQ48506.1 GDSL lipase family protein [Neisseria lactamica]
MPSEKPMNRRTFLLGAGALLLTACGRKSARTHAKIPEGSTVLALGDSLTFGYGANPDESYPAQLQKLTGWNVVNGGVSGDTSAQALSRLPALLARKPKLVIVGIGGNDFLRKVPEEQTRANIAKIIETVQKENIPAVLVGVPHITLGALFGHLSDHPLYEDLSEEYGIPLFGGAWAEILGDNNLKSDQIHANGKGYRRFAEKLSDFLHAQGFR